MNNTEKIIIKAMADLAIHVTEIGKAQMKIASFISQNVPGLSADSKQEILAESETSWLHVQSLQDKAKTLQALLK